MDEVGSAISHSEDPNFRCAPFLFVNNGLSYSIIWPIKDIRESDLITRDYYPRESFSPLERKAHLLAWFPDGPMKEFETAYQVKISTLCMLLPN